MDGMANYDPFTCSACRRLLVKTTEVFACGSIRGLLILLETRPESSFSPNMNLKSHEGQSKGPKTTKPSFNLHINFDSGGQIAIPETERGLA